MKKLFFLIFLKCIVFFDLKPISKKSIQNFNDIVVFSIMGSSIMSLTKIFLDPVSSKKNLYFLFVNNTINYALFAIPCSISFFYMWGIFSEKKSNIAYKLISNKSETKELSGIAQKVVDKAIKQIDALIINNNNNNNNNNKGITKFIFYGSSGTGKTIAVEELIKKIAINNNNKKVYECLLTPDMASSKYLGDNATFMKQFFDGIFTKAEDKNNIFCVHVSECDYLFGELPNDSSQYRGYYSSLRGALLNQLDKAAQYNNIFIICTTNYINNCDLAIKNRFMRYIFLMPDIQSRINFIKKITACFDKNITFDIDIINFFANKTAGKSFREIENIFVSIVNEARSKIYDDQDAHITITKTDIILAINQLNENLYLNCDEALEKYSRDFDFVFGQEDIKNRFNLITTMLIDHPKLVSSAYNNAYLYGEPGAGKTMLAEAFICNFIKKYKEKKKEDPDLAVFSIGPNNFIDTRFFDTFINQVNALAEEGVYIFVICNEMNACFNNLNANSIIRSNFINDLFDSKKIYLLATANEKLYDQAFVRRFRTYEEVIRCQYNNQERKESNKTLIDLFDKIATNKINKYKEDCGFDVNFLNINNFVNELLSKKSNNLNPSKAEKILDEIFLYCYNSPSLMKNSLQIDFQKEENDIPWQLIEHI